MSDSSIRIHPPVMDGEKGARLRKSLDDECSTLDLKTLSFIPNSTSADLKGLISIHTSRLLIRPKHRPSHPNPTRLSAIHHPSPIPFPSPFYQPTFAPSPSPTLTLPIQNPTENPRSYPPILRPTSTSPPTTPVIPSCDPLR